MSTEEMNMQELESQFNEQERLRREKLVQLQEAGKDPFDVYKVNRTHSSQQVKDNYEELEGKDVTVAGRIMSKRGQGKVVFSDIYDRDGKIQLFIKIDEVGEEALKQAQVLSGGEKVRCMLSKLMLSNANVLVLDDPTNHLDLESITSVNKGLEKFPGVLLFNSHDQEMIQTLANRIIEITPGGIMDRKTTLEEYLENKDIQAQLKKMYDVQNA